MSRKMLLFLSFSIVFNRFFEVWLIFFKADVKSGSLFTLHVCEMKTWEKFNLKENKSIQLRFIKFPGG